MTGAGAPRAAFGFGFRGRHWASHSIARGVTDPGIGCTDWLGLFFIGDAARRIPPQASAS
jgi:hypothetical protein